MLLSRERPGECFRNPNEKISFRITLILTALLGRITSDPNAMREISQPQVLPRTRPLAEKRWTVKIQHQRSLNSPNAKKSK
jgi:hypothetical protein